MTFTLMSLQVSNSRAIPVASVPVTVSEEGQINAANITPVIIPIIPLTNLGPADLAASGTAVNLLGAEHVSEIEGGHIPNLPEIFTPFSE